MHAWSHNEPLRPGETYSPALYIRSFALIHLRYLDPGCLSWAQLTTTSVLSRRQFRFMYGAVRRSGEDGDLDPYLVFTNVISEYGTRLDPV